MRNRLLAFVLAVAALAPPVAEAGPKFTVAVVNGSFRVLPGGVPAAGYMLLRNFTDTPVVLTGARSDGCGSLMMHRSSNTGGMSRMESLSTLTIAAHGEARFEPGGMHLMCMAPTSAMFTARRMNVTLLFEGNRSATASFLLTDARGIAHK